MTRGEGEGGKKLRSVVTALQKAKTGYLLVFISPFKTFFLSGKEDSKRHDVIFNTGIFKRLKGSYLIIFDLLLKDSNI